MISRHDATLIRDFLAGDRAALATVDRWIAAASWSYRPRLADEWEDFLQDMRLELTRLLRARLFRGDASLKTYLWRVVHHACLDRLRSRRRWRRAEWEALDDNLDHDDLVLEDDGAAHLVRDLTTRVLEKTPPPCRCLWARLLAGYSYSEMSRELGCPEGTLRVRALRCRRRARALRARLSGGEDAA